jgi:hypothetical protein
VSRVPVIEYVSVEESGEANRLTVRGRIVVPAPQEKVWTVLTNHADGARVYKR